MVELPIVILEYGSNIIAETLEMPKYDVMSSSMISFITGRNRTLLWKNDQFVSRKGRRWEGRKRKAGRCLWNRVSSMRSEPLSAFLTQTKYPSMSRYISPCLNRPLLVGTLYTQDAHANRNLCWSTLHVVFAQRRWRLPGSYQVAYGDKILPPILFIGDAFMLEIKSVDVAFQNLEQYGRVTGVMSVSRCYDLQY